MDSNFVDLANDVLRKREKKNLAGWQTFAKALYSVNTPQDLIARRHRWE